MGISVRLMQIDRFLDLIAYVSKSLSESQRNYSTTNRELVALVFALEQLRQLILFYEVNFYTDHLTLLDILTRTTKDGILNRWVLLVQEYWNNLHYLPDKQNIFSDILSRLVDVTRNAKNLQRSYLIN